MANRNVARIQRTCQQCSKSFDVAPSALKGGALYCSRTCKNAASIVKKITKTCQRCGTIFQVFPSRPNFKFCGRECFGLSKRLTLDDKFWSKVSKTETCWLWTGATRINGYGVLQFPKGVNHQAHRMSWEIHFGPIPTGLHVCHKCDVRNCINPKHLFLGTRKDNMQDCAQKGRNNRKLNPEVVRQIRQHHLDGVAVSVIAADYQIDRSMVHRIVKRQSWSHVE